MAAEIGSASDSQFPKSRVILQQCLSAKLQTQPATDENPAEFVEIGRGLVVYVCFMKGASSDIIDTLVKAVLNTRLSFSDSSQKLVSILDLPGDLLVVPQATLGGRLKGKMMQYHSNIDKSMGHQLYNDFINLCQSTLENSPKCQENGNTVKWGTYGNRQVLQMDTNGPYSHIVDF